MSELFPPARPATALGLSDNIGVPVFGGMGPAIMTWLGGFAPGHDLRRRRVKPVRWLRPVGHRRIDGAYG